MSFCWCGRPRGAHCAFEITLSWAITLTLLLVCAFSPRVHSIPRGPRYYALAFELPEGSAAKLLDKRYVGREVSVAPYRGGDTLQYLILDPSTDKTIVKY